MGSSFYSADLTTSYLSSHKRAGTNPFTHHAAIDSGTIEAKVNEKLDPSKLNKAGKNIRESFDNPEHPNSRPIAILLDETGSLRDLPPIFIEKLNKLMAGLVKKGYVSDPQILFGGIGDAYSDRAPLQLGQFESGNEMTDTLSLIYLEGNGGSQQSESYELAMYYMARHTELDSVNKRGEKGYLFIVGDEKPYTKINKSQVKEIIGDSIQADIPTQEILEELREKFEVFWIFPKGASNYNDKGVSDHLRNLFGQNLFRLENPDDICELIISTIGLSEGFDLNDIKSDLKDIGSDDDSIARAAGALKKYNKFNVAKNTKFGSVSAPIPTTKNTDSVEKI